MAANRIPSRHVCIHHVRSLPFSLSLSPSPFLCFALICSCRTSLSFLHLDPGILSVKLTNGLAVFADSSRIIRGRRDIFHFRKCGRTPCGLSRRQKTQARVELVSCTARRRKMRKIARSTPLGSSRAGCRSYQRIYLPFPSVAHLSPRLSSRLFTRNLPT